MTTQKLPFVLEDDQRKALLNTFNTRYPSGLKNLCMTSLMLDAGLRVSEVTALKPAHLDMTTCKLRVIDGKGGKDRNLWVSENLRDLIGDWLAIRPDSEFLFPTSKGAQTDRKSIHRTIATYAKKAGIKADVSPHTLRHTFATRLYRETNNIRLVQKGLGHSDLSTTMIYTHIVDAELEQAMQAL